jgi:hypothetical protein
LWSGGEDWVSNSGNSEQNLFVSITLEHWRAILKLDEAIVTHLRVFASQLPAATIIVFASVVGYYAGYFSWFAGFSIPPIDAQDLSLSSIALVGLALTVFNFWNQFDILSKLPSTWKFVVILVSFGIYSAIFFEQLAATEFDKHKIEFWVSVSRMSLALIATFAFGLFLFFKNKSTTIGIQEASAFLILAAIFIFCFGFQAFVTDLKQSKYTTVASSGPPRDLFILRIMSSNIVAFDQVNCHLILMSRSIVSSIEFKSTPISSVESPNVFDCVFR